MPEPITRNHPDPALSRDGVGDPLAYSLHSQSVLPTLLLPGKLEEYYHQDGPDPGKPDLIKIAEVLASVPGLLPADTAPSAKIFHRISPPDRFYSVVERFESAAGPVALKLCDLSTVDDIEISENNILLDIDCLRTAKQHSLKGFPTSLLSLEVAHENKTVSIGVICRFENISRTLDDVAHGGTPAELAEAKNAILDIIHGGNEKGLFLWDGQANNFVQLATGEWMLIDPGSVSRGKQHLQGEALKTLFQSNRT